MEVVGFVLVVAFVALVAFGAGYRARQLEHDARQLQRDTHEHPTSHVRRVRGPYDQERDA